MRPDSRDHHHDPDHDHDRRDDHRLVRRLIGAHFALAGGPADEAVMRSHLPGCAACRDHYDRHILFAHLDPRGPGAEDRLARALGFAAQPRNRRGGWTWRALGAVAVAAALVVVARPLLVRPGARSAGERGRSGDSGFVARGGTATTTGTGAGTGAAMPEALVFSVPPGGGAAAAVVGKAVAARDELAFAYRNAAGKRRLMVLGIDEHGHVYWYHPAWTTAAEDPAAVPISTEPGLHELPAAVGQALDGERLAMHALFTDRELTVRQVEAAVAAAHATAEAAPLAIDGALDVVQVLRVTR